MSRRRRPWVLATGAVLVLWVAIQLVPYGRGRTNPPVVMEPRWDSPETRALARRACFDCHSNETHWPFYARVAPVSWLVRHDVDEARSLLNFSEWHRPQRKAADAAKVVLEGEMPRRIYTLMHAHARLTDPERLQLAVGLARTIGTTLGPDEARTVDWSSIHRHGSAFAHRHAYGPQADPVSF